MPRKHNIEKEIFKEIENVPSVYELEKNESLRKHLNLNIEEYDEIVYHLAAGSIQYEDSKEYEYEKILSQKIALTTNIRRFHAYDTLGLALKKFYGSNVEFYNKNNIYELNDYIYFKKEDAYKNNIDFFKPKQIKKFLKFINK